MYSLSNFTQIYMLLMVKRITESSSYLSCSSYNPNALFLPSLAEGFVLYTLQHVISKDNPGKSNSPVGEQVMSKDASQILVVAQQIKKLISNPN